MRRTMLNLIAIAALAAGLAACGADGEPVRPSLNAGLGVSQNGVHAGGSVGLRKGPISLSVGL